MELSEQDAGKVMKAKTGEAITISLAENRTAGFRWAVVGRDQTVVRVLSEEYRAGGNKLGAPGHRSFVFQIVRPGRAVIRLVYGRSWEGSPMVRRQYEVTVDVT